MRVTHQVLFLVLTSELILSELWSLNLSLSLDCWTCHGLVLTQQINVDVFGGSGYSEVNKQNVSGHSFTMKM